MIGDIKNIRSYSHDNETSIVLDFNWGVDIDLKSLEAREKLDGIRDQLPDDIERIFIYKWSSADEEILALRLSSKRDLSNAFDMLNRNLKRRVIISEKMENTDNLIIGPVVNLSQEMVQNL